MLTIRFMFRQQDLCVQWSSCTGCRTYWECQVNFQMKSYFYFIFYSGRVFCGILISSSYHFIVDIYVGRVSIHLEFFLIRFRYPHSFCCIWFVVRKDIHNKIINLINISRAGNFRMVDIGIMLDPLFFLISWLNIALWSSWIESPD